MEKVNHIDIEALIPAEERDAVFQSVVANSKVLPLMTRLPDMSTNKERLKIMDVLPVTYWLEGNYDHKKTTKLGFKDKYIYAEEIACIIIISVNDLRDQKYDFWGNAKPRILEAMQKAVDAAILFGTSKPASFPDGIVNLAFSQGHQIAPAVGEDLYSVIDRAMGAVEETGHEVTGLVGGLGTKSAFRKLRDTTGQLIVGSEINELPKFYVNNGSWDSSKANFVLGDFKQAVYSVRQGIEFKLLEEATIVDPVSGEEVHLAQQDCVALRATMRLGWQMPDPVSSANPNDRLAFSVVVPVANKITVSGPASVTFEESLDVELSANVKGAKIYYTDDGSTPTSASTLYEGPITLTATKTIKAIAIKDNYANSDVFSATYTKA